MLCRSLSFSLLVLLAACSGKEETPKTAPPPAGAETLALTADPGAALGVAEAKALGPQKSVVIEGRVHDLTKGFAVAKLMDTKLEYCGQVNKEDGCKTPWDYCCDPAEERVANSLLVEVRDPTGTPLAAEALPSPRLCDLVKVRGELIKDEHGNLVLVANGWFQVERPEMPDDIRWPQ